jgi:hypothetical protein
LTRLMMGVGESRTKAPCPALLRWTMEEGGPVAVALYEGGGEVAEGAAAAAAAVASKLAARAGAGNF